MCGWLRRRLLRTGDTGLARDTLAHALARRTLATPVVVMLTPDAYARDAAFLERLTEPVREGIAAHKFAPGDWVMVWNYNDGNSPTASTLPAPNSTPPSPTTSWW